MQWNVYIVIDDAHLLEIGILRKLRLLFERFPKKHNLVLLGHPELQRNRARQAYHAFVVAGKGVPSPLLATRHQLILGDDAFVEQHHQNKAQEELRELSRAHRRSLALPLADYEKKYAGRNEAMAQAYKSGAYTMVQIAEYFGVHYMTVSRAVREAEMLLTL